MLFTNGARVEFFQAALNGLYVPERKVLGGHLGLSVTVPVGHIDIETGVAVGAATATRQTDGWGLGDVNARVQLGWEHGALSHLVYLQGVLPTGRYENGFNPNIGLNRPGIDTGWAFTVADKKSKWQVNGALGVTFNFENEDTDYQAAPTFISSGPWAAKSRRAWSSASWAMTIASSPATQGRGPFSDPSRAIFTGTVRF